MRRTAMILGIISGIWGMIIGFFGYGYTEFIDWFGEVPDVIEQVENVNKTRTTALLSPVLALVGGGLVITRPTLGGVLLLLSAFGMFWGFEFGVFTMFPITLCGIAGLFGILSGLLKTD